MENSYIIIINANGIHRCIFIPQIHVKQLNAVLVDKNEFPRQTKWERNSQLCRYESSDFRNESPGYEATGVRLSNKSFSNSVQPLFLSDLDCEVFVLNINFHSF